MDQAQGAAGTGEAEQPTQTQPATAGRPEPMVEKAPLSPLQAAVRGELGLESEGGGQKSDQKAEEEPKTESEVEPEVEPEVEVEEEKAEGEEEKKEPEEDGEHDVPDDWPKTAKARVAEEARKRRERTKELEEWKAEAQKLAAQLQQATAVQLQPTKVLSEVVDKQSLAAAEAHWKEIRRFARTNPDGAFDVFIGKDAQGNDVRRDYPKEEIIKMGLDADEAFDALPVVRERVLAAERETEAARKVYPDLFKDTEAGREAAAIVQQNPWVLQHPDYAYVIGDYLAGRKMRLAKSRSRGTGTPAGAALSPGAQAILEAPKVIPAPGVIKSRSASGGGMAGPRGGGGGERVDTKQANEEFYAKGMTGEALEEKIKRKLAASQGGRTGGKQAALV